MAPEDNRNRYGADFTEPPPQNLLLLSLISAVFYLSVSLVIFYVTRDYGIYQAFGHGYSFRIQILTGIVAGCIGAALIGVLMKRHPVSDVLDDFYIFRYVSGVKFSAFDRVQLSFFAGVGEELLFRGAIQPVLGIWITSVIFVGIHGYFKFRSAGHLLFGAMMFGLSMGLGYIFEHAGLVAAMTAHAVYDVIVLKLVQKAKPWMGTE